MLYAVVDTVLTGHASPTDLAAMGLGAGVYSSVFVSLLGAINALNPIIAQHHGGQRHVAIGLGYAQACGWRCYYPRPAASSSPFPSYGSRGFTRRPRSRSWWRAICASSASPCPPP